MEVIAKSNHIRISARKMRLIADLIRGMKVSEALNVLLHLNKRGAKPFLDLVKQAKGNAVNNFSLVEESLVIKEVQVTEGPTYKRWIAVSRGRANTLFKRTSHLRLVVSGVNLPAGGPKPAPRRQQSQSTPKASQSGGQADGQASAKPKKIEPKKTDSKVKEKKSGTKG